MKSVFITFNQAHYEQLVEILDKLTVRGFTFWEQVKGRGSKSGEPHYGSHAWPTMNSAMITMVDDDKAAPLLEAIHELDAASEMQGLRAFVWDITQTV